MVYQAHCGSRPRVSLHLHLVHGSLVSRPHFSRPPEKWVRSTSYSIFAEVRRNVGVLFFSNLTFHGVCRFHKRYFKRIICNIKHTAFYNFVHLSYQLLHSYMIRLAVWKLSLMGATLCKLYLPCKGLYCLRHVPGSF